MATFFIFRHGETFATKANIGYGLKQFSAPILIEGKPAMEKLAQYLKGEPADFCVSSPYKRCKETVEIVTEMTGKTFIFDKRLGEFFLETQGHLEARVKSLLQEIKDKNYQNIWICSHQAVILTLLRQILDANYQTSPNPTYPRPGILLKVSEKEFKEIDFN